MGAEEPACGEFGRGQVPEVSSDRYKLVDAIRRGDLSAAHLGQLDVRVVGVLEQFERN
jgi:hypothetical protein